MVLDRQLRADSTEAIKLGTDRPKGKDPAQAKSAKKEWMASEMQVAAMAVAREALAEERAAAGEYRAFWGELALGDPC